MDARGRDPRSVIVMARQNAARMFSCFTLCLFASYPPSMLITLKKTGSLFPSIPRSIFHTHLQLLFTIAQNPGARGRRALQ